MVALYQPGYEPGTYREIRRQVQQQGQCSGGAVTFWREDYEPADGTMRLQVRCQSWPHDIIYGCDARELAAYEQPSSSSSRGDT